MHRWERIIVAFGLQTKVMATPPGVRRVVLGAAPPSCAWEYGSVAQVLHLGTYAEEEPTIDKLHAFIAEQGLEIAGPHEEIYLSRPGAANQKTIVRYQVRRPA